MSGLRLFLRCRRATPIVVGLLVVAGVQYAMVRSQSVPVGGWVAATELLVPAALLVPLVGVGLLSGSVDSATEVVENLSARPMIALRLGAVTALTVVAMTIFPLATGLSGASDLSLAVARNVAGFWGMALVASPFLGSACWLLPVIYVGNAVFFGVTPDGSPAWWAWCLDQTATAQSIFAAGLLVVVGLLALVTHWGRRASSLRP